MEANLLLHKELSRVRMHGSQHSALRALRCCMVHVAAQRCMVLHGAAQRCMVLHSSPWHAWMPCKRPPTCVC